ncbi:lysoplasmalogenase [Vibrio sp. 2art]|uniref:lysoplasmalogenase n=1 Tax=Vibrio TaxID=662 RepID=UPI001BD6CB5E|nr:MULTISPECIES: lysoplasmalogenase [Vibrio]MBS9875596.1 lysoplasmalogenase [Vibrio alginolyticus]MBY7685653.1 lysoplasmalogenase [Vibrio alginolyticus]MCR9442894.1 lysoplasmalogenase [Vibrio alginolyticus]MCR9447418.1 lysoplasmalogenase [Vibrio alginolyticus]MCR9456588.1 lysoplasmalogenase [Vibrio alginolyticus]
MWSWLAIGLSGVYSVLGAKQANPTQSLVFKIFTLLLLLVLVLTQGASATYTYWIAGGLIVSMVADTLHSFKTRKLIYFTAYLVAQVCYSKSFWVQLNGEIVWWLLALLLAASIVAFFLLLPQLDSLVFPVVIMGMMLVQLTWAAGEVWLQVPSYANAIGFSGTLVLIYSALAYAIHGYRKPMKHAYLWVSGSYFFAHALIVASIIY